MSFNVQGGSQNLQIQKFNSKQTMRQHEREERDGECGKIDMTPMSLGISLCSELKAKQLDLCCGSQVHTSIRHSRKPLLVPTCVYCASLTPPSCSPQPSPAFAFFPLLSFEIHPSSLPLFLTLDFSALSSHDQSLCSLSLPTDVSAPQPVSAI